MQDVTTHTKTHSPPPASAHFRLPVLNPTPHPATPSSHALDSDPPNRASVWEGVGGPVSNIGRGCYEGRKGQADRSAPSFLTMGEGLWQECQRTPGPSPGLWGLPPCHKAKIRVPTSHSQGPQLSQSWEEQRNQCEDTASPLRVSVYKEMRHCRNTLEWSESHWVVDLDPVHDP